MTHLRELSLPRCHLHGPLPDWLFHHLPHLRTLDLSNNQLTGPLPPSLGRCCPRLEIVKLSFNAFEGAAFVCAWRVPRAATNQPTNQPKPINQLTKSPHINPPPLPPTGEIPASWATLPALKTLSLSYNRLSGPVPALRATTLEALLLGGNSFTGHVPELGACPALQKLLLNGNNLSGRLVSGGVVFFLGGGKRHGVWGLGDCFFNIGVGWGSRGLWLGGTGSESR